MSVFRATLILSFVSLAAALSLLYLGSGYEEFSGGYAVLTVDASIDDNIIHEILEPHLGSFAGFPVSESTQWVMIDNFGSLEKIPLDTYQSRILPFDPRNDGYASKLRDVFVQNEKRFFYIPLKAGKWSTAFLDNQLTDFMKGISFSVKYYGIGKPLYLFFIAYAAAALALLVIFYFTKNKFRGTAYIIPLLPVLSSLSYIGASGIVCAAFIFGFFLLFREPLTELFRIEGLFNFKNKKNKSIIYKNIIKPYRSYLPFIPIFAAAFAILVRLTPLKMLYLILVFTMAIVLFFISCKTIPVMLRRRFTPVLIINRRFVEFGFSLYMIPFFIFAFFAMFFTPYVSSAYISGEKFETIINEEDYNSHLLFQSTFSMRQLNTSFDIFPLYFYDEDGLPSPDGLINNNHAENYGEFPEFPLKNLMTFFNDVNNGARTRNTGNIERMTDILSLVVLLLFILPGIFIRTDNVQNNNFSGIKKIDGKQRFISFIRNNSYVNSGKNKIRLRKDA